MKKYILVPLCAIGLSVAAQVNPKLQTKLDQQAKEIETRVVEWRRHLHQNPELSNRETQTAVYIAELI
jgi:hypothetical protein